MHVGPPNCTVSLTASRVTADSSVISWDISHCLGPVPTVYRLDWYPIGGRLEVNYTIINSSTSTGHHKIIGLTSSVKYFILIFLIHNGNCGIYYSALAEMEQCGDETEDDVRTTCKHMHDLVPYYYMF